MSSDSENFDQLRRLMAIKRHEQPPPGYFNTFSDGVISGIRAQQNGKDLTEALESAPWLLRLLTLLETKPVFAGAFGVGICALLITGIIYSEQVQPAPMALAPTPGLSLVSAAPAEDQVSGRMPDSAVITNNLFKDIQLKETPVNYAMPVAPGGFPQISR